MVFQFLNRNRQSLLLGGGIFCTFYGGLVLLNDKITNVKKFDTPELEDPEEAKRQKVYLVTGANSGIGKALVSNLARHKNSNKVYMLCRDMEKCESVRTEIVKSSGNKYVYCRPCNLASFQSVRECAKLIQEKEDRIDGLVNNAGVMFAPKSVTEDGMEIHWSVNHLGHFLLTKLLENQLENGGRVLFMVNLDYRKAKQGIKFDDINMTKEYDKNYAFYQSQLANVLITQSLAKELYSKMITVNCVYPGIVNGTGIKRHMGVDKSLNPLTRWLLSITEKTAENAVHTLLFLLSDRTASGLTGKMYTNMNEMALLENATNEQDGEKLKMIDEYWTGLKSKEELVKKK